MGLFDDLLKKPTSTPATDSSTGTSGSNPTGTGGVNPPITDPLAAMNPPPVIKIEKTEEVSITTESAADTASDTPPPVTAVAIDDVSSILISSTPTTPIVVTSTPEDIIAPIVTTSSESLISNIEVAAPAPVITKTSEVVDLGNLFGETKTEEASIVTPISAEETPEIVAIESTPIVEESITITESAPIVEEAIPVITSSIPVETEVVPEVVESESIIDMEESTPVEIEPIAMVEESTINFGSAVVEEEVSQEIEESYEHPSEFIAASIARIDAMIARIDTAHGTKLEEALGYKTEKEKYTTLEERAYADAEKYVTEKDHALAMRNYFVDQGKAAEGKSEKKVSEPVASVETTLTGLAVQNAVSETVKHEKKVKSKKEEESVGLLGL